MMIYVYIVTSSRSTYVKASIMASINVLTDVAGFQVERAIVVSGDMALALVLPHAPSLPGFVSTFASIDAPKVYARTIKGNTCLALCRRCQKHPSFTA